jgi:hypothetical protein
MVLFTSSMEGLNMTKEALVLMVLIVLISGVLLTKPHSVSWGYGPIDSLVLVLVALLILVFVQGTPLIGGRFQPAGALRSPGYDLQSAGRNLADTLGGGFSK